MEMAEKENRISFLSNGDIIQAHPLKSGDTFMIHYEMERLKRCESTQNQIPQWGITGHIQTDVSEKKLFNVTENQNGTLITLDVELEVPEGDVLYIWFTASNRYGCFEEDRGASFEIE